MFVLMFNEILMKFYNDDKRDSVGDKDPMDILKYLLQNGI